MVLYVYFLEYIYIFCYFISDVYQGIRVMVDLSYFQCDVLVYWGIKIYLQWGCGQ